MKGDDILPHINMQKNVREGVQEVKDIFDDKFLELLKKIKPPMKYY